jgi:hypothetical protein
MRFKLIPVSFIIIFFFTLTLIIGEENRLSYFFAIILVTLIGYPLTIYDQGILNKIFRWPFVKAVNKFNNLFGTKFQSAMLLQIRKNLMPYVDYGYRNNVKIGVHTNALVAGDYLIKYLKENNETGIKNTSEWLLKNYENKGNYIIWKANYERPDFNLKKGWVSGYYQSRALKALCMFYERTKDKKILNLIIKGLNAFEVNIENDGFKVDDKYGYWYEEYPQKGQTPPYVLNGFLESLLDLYFIYEKTRIKKTKGLFDKGLIELKARIKEFDTGNWTYYDLLKHFARFDYHKTHIREMNDIYKITNDKLFLDIAERWKKYKKADWRFYILNIILLDFIITILMISGIF